MTREQYAAEPTTRIMTDGAGKTHVVPYRKVCTIPPIGRTIERLQYGGDVHPAQ